LFSSLDLNGNPAKKQQVISYNYMENKLNVLDSTSSIYVIILFSKNEGIESKKNVLKPAINNNVFDVVCPWILTLKNKVDIHISSTIYNIYLYNVAKSNGNILVLGSDTLYVSDADFNYIRAFPVSKFKFNFLNQTFTDVQYLSDGNILLSGIASAVFAEGPYNLKIDCNGSHIWYRYFENSTANVNAGFVEDTDGGIVNLLQRSDGYMWLEKRNPWGKLERWTPIAPIKHTIIAKAFPNPAQDYTIIETSEPYTGTIQMYNALGQLMHSEALIANCYSSINTTQLQAGVYLIKFISPLQQIDQIKLIITNN
jgi:hypothetical protein